MPLFSLLGIILLLIGFHALATGRVLVGSRGFKSGYYCRRKQPFLYYAFVAFYFLVAAVLLL